MSLLAQAAAQADLQELALNKERLVTDGKTQARIKLDPATVDEYAEVLTQADAAGQPWPFPPVKVIRQTHVGIHFDYVWDGFHRTAAAHQAHWPHPIPALVRPGTQRDAVLAAVGANADHGLRRTNEDKRRAVEMLLADEEWRTWSDRMIAEQAKVTHPFVAKIRADLYPPPSTTYPLPAQGEDGEETAPTGNGYQSAPRKGKDGRTIDTSRIGNGRSETSQEGKSEPYAEIWQLENGIRDWLNAPHIRPLKITAYAIRDMADRYPHAPAQADLNDYLPEPRRKADMIQAFNNVAAQVEQVRNRQAGQSRRDWGILATDWLAAYKGKNGETWLNLTENQIYHANSPCFQRFTQQHPECPDPKMALRQALVVLSAQVETVAAKADPRPRFTNSLTVIAGLFNAADEDIWADAQGNTHLSDLRFLVAKMIRELAE